MFAPKNRFLGVRSKVTQGGGRTYKMSPPPETNPDYAPGGT